ncbi:MAG: hypothetical protein RLZZ458_1601 [Planctomycetota bacterium]
MTGEHISSFLAALLVLVNSIRILVPQCSVCEGQFGESGLFEADVALLAPGTAKEIVRRNRQIWRNWQV